MIEHRDFRSSYLAGIALVISLAISPSLASAQCTILYSADTSAAPNTAQIVRILQGSTAAVPCSTTAMTNVNACVVAGVGSGSYGCTNSMGCRALVAIASGVTTNPTPRSCQFNCAPACGTQLIDNSNGLPVELMEFSVEDDDSTGDEQVEDPDEDPSD